MEYYVTYRRWPILQRLFKTVIDFTNMNDEELVHFMSSNKNKKICGRLKTKQIHSIKISLPPNILQTPMSWWKCLLVAVLFAFGSTLFSCQFSIMEDRITQGILLPEHPLPPPPPPAGNIIHWEEADFPTSARYSTDKGDIEMIIVDSAERNPETIQIVSPLTNSLISGTADKIFKAGSSFIQPVKPVNKMDLPEK